MGLVTLDLKSNEISDEGALHLVELFKVNRTLAEVDLKDSGDNTFSPFANSDNPFVPEWRCFGDDTEAQLRAAWAGDPAKLQLKHRFVVELESDARRGRGTVDSKLTG